MLVPHNIVMDMNNIMHGFSHRALIYKNQCKVTQVFLMLKLHKEWCRAIKN
jgi:hypothetical protein